jgi:1,4-dihydroxy-2-naphthoate octaprenyltransferase
MAHNQPEGIVTCDMEGRIQSFDAGAEAIFGHAPGEVIGKKRIAFLVPGPIAIGQLGGWLKTAIEGGAFEGRSVFRRKDGTPFVAGVRITPILRDGAPGGFSIVTTPRPDVPVEEVMPEATFGSHLMRWAVIIRAPFLTASVIPVLLGAAWAVASGRATPFPWAMFLLALLGGAALHVAANTFNDYFDWMSGTDPANNDYFSPFCGGSRSIELGLIDERGLFRFSSAVLGVAVAVGIVVLVVQGPTILLFGLFGAFSVYFYTAPPLRLAARRGLGELFVGLNFGPLMAAGTVFAMTGDLVWTDFLVGVPIGLLIAAVLWINQFPDAEADQSTGKINLVVALGKRRARWGYLLMVGGAFVMLVGGVAAGLFPVGALLMLIALPVAVQAITILFRHYADRGLAPANGATIQLHMLSGLLMSVGVILTGPVRALLKL